VSALDRSVLAETYLHACLLDVEALKPGNVSRESPGHGMCAEDFVVSAEHSVGPLLDTDLGLGERIEQAVARTRERVGCNTNLGILLLCAPLLYAAQRHPASPLREGLRRVLAASGEADARQVYRAIRLANPAGMGRAARHDLADTPRVGLVEAMSAAAERDLIARQYRDGYALLFDAMLPELQRIRAHGADETDAVSELFLWLLGRYPDSHIQRKHGSAAAGRVSAVAAGCLLACRRDGRSATRRRLQALDRRFKRAGLNPGTSADLCVAAVLARRLCRQSAALAGDDMTFTRVTPASGRAAHSTKQQPLEGELQWL